MDDKNTLQPVKHPDVRRANRLRNGSIASISIVAIIWTVTFICHIIGISADAQEMLNILSIFLPSLSLFIAPPLVFSYFSARNKADEIEWKEHVSRMRQLEYENQRQREITQQILKESGLNIDVDVIKNM